MMQGGPDIDVTYKVFEGYDAIKEKCGSENFKGSATFAGKKWKLVVKGASKEECPENIPE